MATYHDTVRHHPHITEADARAIVVERSHPIALTLGRLLFGSYFAFSGLSHFLNHATVTAYAAAAGVPLPGIAVIVSGLLILLGGLMILFGYRPHVGAGLILLFLAGVTPIMHGFWMFDDPQMRMEQMTHFLKNVGLAGGALFVAAVPQPWSLSARVEEPPPSAR